ncbi:uncharacterized protein FOMMEDRAFT_76968, partial [Fomitiporia mediterranea MF3/22]|uniref:uncharacterized protein n=1 Tax=Fomitiporia mediterranea (strain MF3/22) TaxID=694068 RepID=UPI000440964E
FLVRDEYEELDKFITEGGDNHIILTGQPGIGKTVYLTYCLLCRLMRKERTIFMLDTFRRYLFRDKGAYRLPGDLYITNDREILQESSTTLVLYDCNSKQEKATDVFQGIKTLISTSPELSRYDRFDKESYTLTFNMQTWSWSEVYLSW